VILFALMLAACNDQSVSNATVSNTPLTNPATTTSSTSCRLPVSIPRPQGGPMGAFIDYPSGKVTIDPNGDSGRYYDAPFSSWLSQPGSSVSPDGSHYAFGGATDVGTPILHIVDVVGGADHPYSLPSELYSAIGGIDVFEYSHDAIFMGLYGEGYIDALWRFDIATGVTRKVGQISGIGAVDGNIVWRGARNAADPNAWSWVPGSPTNQIERLDLRDGTSQTWLYQPGHLLDVIGVDSAHDPIVRDFADKQTVELSILSSSTTQKLILSGSVDTWVGFIGGVAADSHGVWFGGDKGIYLYSDAGSLKKVSDQAGIPAGACA
jgi:hypothetical protein